MVKNRLKKLKIDELSLVDRPANAGSLAVLHKRDDSDNNSLVDKIKKFFGKATEEEIEEVGKVMDEELSPLTEAMTMSVASIIADDEVVNKKEALEQTLKQFSAAVINKAVKKPDAGAEDDSGEDGIPEPDADDESDTTPPEGTKVKKEDEIPAALTKRLDAAEAEAKTSREALAKLNKERDDEKVLAIAKGMIGSADVKAEPLAKALSEMSEESRAVIKDLLAKHNALLKDNNLIKTLGSDEDSAATPQAQLEKAAADLQKSDPKLTKSQAIAKALESNPELYDASLEG